MKPPASRKHRNRIVPKVRRRNVSLFLLAALAGLLGEPAKGNSPNRCPIEPWVLPGGETVKAKLVMATPLSVTLFTEGGIQHRLDRKSLPKEKADLADAFDAWLAALKAPLEKPVDGEIFEAQNAGDMPYFPPTTFRVQMKSGLANGLGHSYGSGDRLCFVESYLNDALHGDKVQFYPTGEVYSAMHFENGATKGLSFTYFEDGTISQAISWNAGTPEGASASYFRSGGISVVIPIVDGEFHGIGKHLLPDGRFLGTTEWVHGREGAKNIATEITQREADEVESSIVPALGTIWARDKGAKPGAAAPGAAAPVAVPGAAAPGAAAPVAVPVAVPGAAAPGAAAPGAARLWTSTNGKQIQATAVKYADGKVSLKLPNGKVMDFPIDRLIESDRKEVHALFGAD